MQSERRPINYYHDTLNRRFALTNIKTIPTNINDTNEVRGTIIRKSIFSFANILNRT